MKRESRQDKLLRLWKIRQEAEGIDVSSAKTLEEAEHFFDKKPEEKKPVAKKTKKADIKKVGADNG